MTLAGPFDQDGWPRRGGNIKLETAMAAAQRDVFLLGTGFSGSTLLGNALNGHPEMSYAGEVSRLPFFGEGVPFEGCFLCHARHEDCPVFSPSTLRQLEAHGPASAMGILREAFGTPIVVDGSKSSKWFEEIQKQGGIRNDTRVLLTVRNPFAFAFSARKNSGTTADRAARDWRTAMFNLMRRLNRLGVPYLVVRYEDFAYDPEPTLRRVCDFLGTGFSPSMLRFWETPIHAVGGNPGAYVWYGFEDIKHLFPTEEWRAGARDYSKRQFGGWVDDKWTRKLPEEDVRTIAALPGLVDMAALAGYRVPELLNRRSGAGQSPIEVRPGEFRLGAIPEARNSWRAVLKRMLGRD